MPLQNVYVERLIGTLRRECLDHVIVMGEELARQILAEFATYYNEARCHTALQGALPAHREAEMTGLVNAAAYLGGLHHGYAWAALPGLATVRWDYRHPQETVVVGATWESSSATGVNGAEGDNSTNQAGASYVYDLDLGLGSTYCTAAPNSTGAPAAISASGSASLAANNLLLRAAPVPDQPGVFFYGPGQTSIPFGNGTLCITGQIGRLDVVNATGNVMTLLVDNTSPPSAPTQITAGSTWNFQAWFRDPAAGGALFDLSDGLSVAFGL